MPASAEASYRQPSLRRLSSASRPQDLQAIPALNTIAADPGAAYRTHAAQGDPTYPKDLATEYFESIAPEPQLSGPAGVVIHATPVIDPDPFPSRPLYFEDVNLERYGHHAGWCQPIVSGSHFAFSTLVLPYRLTAEPPTSRVFQRYPYPAGTSAPPVDRQAVWDRRAAAVEILTVAGIVLLLP